MDLPSIITHNSVEEQSPRFNHFFQKHIPAKSRGTPMLVLSSLSLFYKDSLVVSYLCINPFIQPSILVFLTPNNFWENWWNFMKLGPTSCHQRSQPNSLHLNIKQVAHDINKFKHKLRKFLTENSFYSVEEYLDRKNKFDLGVSH
jgi:hypothetical protein